MFLLSYANNYRPARGQLIIGSNSLVFAPNDFSIPVTRCMYKDVHEISKAKNTTGLSKKTKGLQIDCEHVLQLQQHNNQTRTDSEALSTFLIAVNIDDCEQVQEKLDALVLLAKAEPNLRKKGVTEAIKSFEQTQQFNQTYLDSTWKPLPEKLIHEDIVDMRCHFEHVRGIVAISAENLYFQPFVTCRNEPQVYRTSMSSVKKIVKSKYMAQEIALEVHFFGESSFYFVFDT